MCVISKDYNFRKAHFKYIILMFSTLVIYAAYYPSTARAALSAVTAGRQFVEKRLASHQAQSLLEAVSSTSAAQAAATASAVSMALETGVWNTPDHARDQEDDNNQDGDDDEDAAADNDEERGADGESRVLKSNIVGYPESDDEDNSNVRELGAVSSLPNDLQELRRQLNFLRNEFSMVGMPFFLFIYFFCISENNL